MRDGRHDDRELREPLIAIKALLLGTAYTVWTGIGAVGAFIVGVTFLGDS